MGKVCQSCGMPMNKDAQGGGTEADGTISAKYCSHCYQNGAFTQPNLTVDKMREQVIGKLREMHFPGFAARWMSRNVSKLARWQ